MTYEEMMQQLANAKPARFASPTRAKDLLGIIGTGENAHVGVVLSAHDRALINGLAPAIHEYIQSEIAKAVAPLKAQLAELKTLTASRPPAGEHWGHGDARGPNFFEDPTNNYWGAVASASGIAAAARILDGGGGVCVSGLSVGTSGNENIVLNSTAIEVGDPIVISSAVITHG
jgi:hypothetical protein